jgi:type IX secretion system PorP/SprF family membrane protein
VKSVINILAVKLLLFSSALFAQQESIFTMYRYHMNIINPAYAGVNNETLFLGSIRKQWTGIKDSPETQAFSFGTTVGRNLGIGISMVNDKTFIEKQTMVGIDFSYKLKMNEKADLYLGIKAGSNFYDINTSGIQTYNLQADPALTSISNYNPNVGVGVLLKGQKYFISFSVPKMLNKQGAKNQDGYASVVTESPHIYLSVGYDFNLNSNGSTVLKPSFLMRYLNNAPVSFDINTILQIQNNFEIGATYRNNSIFAGIFDFTVSKKMMIGYVYEFSTTPEFASAKNSNEFFIRFKI